MEPYLGGAAAGDAARQMFDGRPTFLFARKARLRTPKNWEQFKSATIRCGDDRWADEGPLTKPSKTSDHVALVMRAFADAYERLADAVDKTPGFDGKPVKKIGVDKLRDELKSRGFLETTETGGLNELGRKHFQRVKTRLLDSNRWIEKDDLIWRAQTPVQPVTRDTL